MLNEATSQNSPLKLTDAHIHLSSFEPTAVEPYLLASRDHSVLRFIMAGFEPDDWQKQNQLKMLFPNKIFSAFGLHPWHVIKTPKKTLESQFETLENLIHDASFIGETGIDYHDKNGIFNKALQVEIFERTIDLAVRCKKPLILHVVKAHEDALKILQTKQRHFKLSKFQGLVHHFSGSFEIAKRYTGLGFKISVGPGILASGFEKLKAACQKLSDSDLVLETDSPQSPDDHSPNPGLLLSVATELGRLRNQTLLQIAKNSETNIDELLSQGMKQ